MRDPEMDFRVPCRFWPPGRQGKSGGAGCGREGAAKRFPLGLLGRRLPEEGLLLRRGGCAPRLAKRGKMWYTVGGKSIEFRGKEVAA